MYEAINAPSASTWVDLFVTGPLKARFRKGKNRKKSCVVAGAESGAARAGVAAQPKTRDSSILHRAASPSAPAQVKSRPGGEPRAKPTRTADGAAGGNVARQAMRSLRISTHPSKVPSQMSGNALTRSPAIGAQNEIPGLTERLAEAVAARVQGLPGGKGEENVDKKADKRAAEYLDELATWQAARADSALARLITAFDGSPDSSQGDSKSSRDSIRFTMEASKAWLMSSCLNGDGPPIGTQALDSAIDRHLQALAPRALVSLHRHALAMERGAANARQDGVRQLYLGMVGMPAARRVWAARQVCDLVGKPMSFDQTRDLLRVTSANDPTAVSNGTALLEVAAQLNALMVARYLPTLTQRLRVRARAALDAKNIGVNALADIAKRHRESSLYASMVADGLRGTLTQTPAHSDETQPLRHLTDTQIRERLDEALDELSTEEIAAAKASLVPRGGATAEYTLYLKRLVELCGAGRVEQASLGRQFTILCEALARRTVGASNAPALQALRGWDWDVRLTRHDPPASQPGRLARVGSTLYRVVRRAVLSVFDPYGAALYRARDARRDLEKAASDFMETVSRNAMRDATEELRTAERHIRRATVPRQAAKSSPPVPDASLRAYNESESRLMKAANRYHGACEKLGADGCKFLGLATNPAQFYEAAFRTALSRMPGARVDALGRGYLGQEWRDNLLRRQRIYRALASTRVPRTPSAMASMFARSTGGGAQQSELLQSRFLLGCVETVLRDEPAIRAAAEVVRTLANHVCTQAASASAATATATTTATACAVGASTAIDAAARATVETPASGAQRKVRPLDDTWMLEQRFRPLEHQHGFTADWSREYFVRAGMHRLSAAERERLGDVIGNLDWRPPAWLQNDELWLAVVRYYQGMSPQRTDA